MPRFTLETPNVHNQQIGDSVKYANVYLRSSAGDNLLVGETYANTETPSNPSDYAFDDKISTYYESLPAFLNGFETSNAALCVLECVFDNPGLKIDDISTLEVMCVDAATEPHDFDAFIDFGDGVRIQLVSVRGEQWQSDKQLKKYPVVPVVITAAGDAVTTGTETTATADPGSIGEVDVVAVVTQSDSGEILKVDTNKTGVMFVNGRTKSYVATVTYKDGLIVSVVPLNNHTGDLLSIAPLGIVSTVDDKALVAKLKKDQKTRALTPLEATTVLLKSSSAANYADNIVINKSTDDSTYTNLRLAGFDDATAKQISTHYGVQVLARDYLAEEQLQIASSDLGQLTKLLKYLDGKNVVYPDFEQYISALRNNAAVMAVVADAGLKVKR